MTHGDKPMTHGDGSWCECPYCGEKNEGHLRGRAVPHDGSLLEFEQRCEFCKKPIRYSAYYGIIVDAETWKEFE